MKKITFLFCAIGAMLLGASCNKNMEAVQTPVDNGMQNGDELVPLYVTVDNVMTKTTDVTKEKKENSVQVFVFNAKNEVECYRAYSSTTDPKLVSEPPVVSYGPKKVWAVVNCPDNLSQVANLNSLKALSMNLEKNTPDNLISVGEGSVEVKTHPTAQDNKVTIATSHLTSKVTIQKIERKFDTYAQGQKELIIKGIYVINAVGSCQLDGTLGDLWYNKSGHSNSEPNAVLYDAENYKLDDNNEYTTAHSFYPYPNNYADETESGPANWAARKSLLVIETTLAGENSFYPLWIPKATGSKLERNCEYIIEKLTLKRPGSSNPWERVTAEDVSVTITVKNYETGATYTEEI